MKTRAGVTQNRSPILLPLLIPAARADATVSSMLPDPVLKYMYFVSQYYVVYLDE